MASNIDAIHLSLVNKIYYSHSSLSISTDCTLHKEYMLISPSGSSTINKPLPALAETGAIASLVLPPNTLISSPSRLCTTVTVSISSSTLVTASIVSSSSNSTALITSTVEIVLTDATDPLEIVFIVVIVCVTGTKFAATVARLALFNLVTVVDLGFTS